MKTPGEILQKYGYSKSIYENPKSDLIKAMEEHSQLQSIAFAEWVENKYMQHGIGNWVDLSSQKTFYSTTELYLKFIELQKCTCANIGEAENCNKNCERP